MSSVCSSAAELLGPVTGTLQGINIRSAGLVGYQDSWQAMREFTHLRDPSTPDEIWLLQHPQVFTLGQAGKTEHLLCPGDIPVLNTDRGGQVTYHGPGQLVMYTLLNLKRAGLGIRGLVSLIEDTVIDCLASHDIEAVSRHDAPGVYVDGSKIAALGLRVSRGCSYHGLALNVDADLEPFARINPCGFRNLAATSMSELGVSTTVESVAVSLSESFISSFTASTLQKGTETVTNNNGENNGSAD